MTPRFEIEISGPALRELSPDAPTRVFQRWIGEQALGELLVDVADYRHVKPGPGLLLVGHESLYGILTDETEARVLLRERRGAPSSGSLADHLRQALGRLLRVAARLDREPETAGWLGAVSRVRVTVNDRRYEPGGPLEEEIAAALGSLAGGWGSAEVFAVPSGFGDTRLAWKVAPGEESAEALLDRLDKPVLAEAISANPLRLPAALAAEIADHGVAGYPEEVCGLLIGRSAPSAVAAEQVVLARNVSPVRRRDRYVLAPEDFLAADLQARKQGLEIVGIWHTHPDHPAVPSATDAEAAWPGYSYVIQTVRSGAAREQRSWRFDGTAFNEQTIEEHPS